MVSVPLPPNFVARRDEFGLSPLAPRPPTADRNHLVPATRACPIRYPVLLVLPCEQP